VTTVAQTLRASDRKVADRTTFFILLIAATATPYLVFPICTQTLQGTDAAMGILQACLFLGAGGHVAASFFFYDDHAMRTFMLPTRASRYILVPLAIMGAAGIVFAFGDRTVKAYATTAFWIWQVHHFTRQNHGILAFASRADGVAVSSAERAAITLTDVAAILATVCFVTPFRATVLAPYAWQLFMVALGVFAVAWGLYLLSNPWRTVREAPWRSLTLLFLMGFYLPLFVFDDPFSAVYIYLTAHGLQYLVFMSFVAANPPATRRRKVAVLVAMTLVGGAVIKLMQNPSMWGGRREALLGLSYGIIIWHFVLDAGVWRLSEPFQRAYMGERFGFLRQTKSGGAAS
jgi:hypothetical protein